MKKILFQGDSITDAYRNKEIDAYRGSGYATLVSAALGCERPDEFEFINRGIFANCITDLIARVKSDFINLEPDYVSILVGVNDARREILEKNGVVAEKFEMYYNILIEEIKESLPDCRIMILEPFVLKAPQNEEIWEELRCEVEKRAAIAKKVAEKNNLVFAPLMKAFDDAAQKAPVSYWAWDGIHPSAAGHEIIKRAWLKAFCELEKRI